jgi:hypothetical protein
MKFPALIAATVTIMAAGALESAAQSRSGAPGISTQGAAPASILRPASSRGPIPTAGRLKAPRKTSASIMDTLDSACGPGNWVIFWEGDEDTAVEGTIDYSCIDNND